MVTTAPVNPELSSRTTQITKNIQKCRPLAQRIERVETHLKTLSVARNELDKQRDQLLEGVDDSGTVGKLREIDCASIQRSINDELSVLNNIKTRFSRNTLNIGIEALSFLR